MYDHCLTCPSYRTVVALYQILKPSDLNHNTKKKIIGYLCEPCYVKRFPSHELPIDTRIKIR